MKNTAQFSTLLALQFMKQDRLFRAFEQLADSPDMNEFLDL